MITDRRAVVLNFGATVLAHDRLRTAATARVRDALARDEAVVVVCSPLAAPAGGEIPWITRFVDALAAIGVRAVALTRAQIGTQPGEAYRPTQLAFLRELLQSGIVPVVSGAMPHGSQLRESKKRSGDVVALTLGDALQASGVIIYGESSGLFTAEPSRIAQATPLRHVGYMEMMELCAIEPHAVSLAAAEIARSTGTTYEVRNVVSDRGTAVREDARMDRSRGITAVAASSGVSLFSVRTPRTAAGRGSLLQALGEHGLAITMLQFVSGGIRFVCDRTDVAAVKTVVSSLGLRSRCVEQCGRLSIVGPGVRSAAGVFYGILRALGDTHIDILHFGDSNVTISMIVAEEEVHRAERVIFEMYALTGGSNHDIAVRFDASTGQLRVRGRIFQLGERQSRLLDLLIENSGRLTDSEEAAVKIFGGRAPEQVSALRVHIHNLRKKLELQPDNPRHIVTVPNRGYMFVR